MTTGSRRHRNDAELSTMPAPSPLRARRTCRTDGFLRRIAAVLLIVCCTAPMLMGGHQAAADDVSDLDAKAQQIAGRLADLQGQVAQIGEQFNQSQVRQQQLATEKADIARRRAASHRTVEARRADAHRAQHGDNVIHLS